MSIPRCCRSRAADRSGQALIVGLMLLVVLLPVGLAFVSFARTAVQASVRERQRKAAGQLAYSAVTDYMRQFSQNAYDGHYDISNLARPEDLYSSGFSTVTFQADEVERTLFLRAQGVFGSGAQASTRTIEALIQFQSDLVQYGTMINGPFTVSASGVSYIGGLWFNGNLSVTGSNVRFDGGPVVVKGNVSAPASAVLDGDLYYSGTSAGSLTVLGTKFNYVPSTTWPTLDFDYYDAHYTYKTTTNKTIVFNADGTFTVVGGATYAIPASGAIIYGDGCNLTIRGAVAGRVTVVAGGTAGSSTKGNITVSDNIYYVGASSIAASTTASFAALAKNGIAFSKTGTDLLVVGVYFVEQGTSNMSMSGSAGKKFWLYGVRTQGISISPSSSFSGGRNLAYDANLRAYPPPGLPEKPLLVNWRAP